MITHSINVHLDFIRIDILVCTLDKAVRPEVAYLLDTDTGVIVAYEISFDNQPYLAATKLIERYLGREQ